MADSTGLSWSVSAALKRVMPQLLAELGASERVERFLEDSTFRNGALVVALTRTRLVLVHRGEVVSVPRPFVVHVADGKFTPRVTVTGGGAAPAPVTMTLARAADVQALRWAATVEARGGTDAGPGPEPRLPAASSSSPGGGLGTRSGSAGRSSPPRPPASEPLADPGWTGGWQAAERAAAAHMRTVGFLDATVTRSGADGGLDVVASGAAAQVKLHTAATGAPAVQQLHGAAHAYPNRLFYATAYTAAAVRAAAAAGVALFTFTVDLDAVPANDQARVLVAGATTGSGIGADRLSQTVRWLNLVVQTASRPVPPGSSKRAAKRALKVRYRNQQALRLANAGLAELGSLDGRSGPLRRASAVRHARSRATDAARLLGMTLPS